MFQQTYLSLLNQLADYLAPFPASEYHHHAYRGGLLDHTLEVACYAVKLRQSYLLPLNASTEQQAQQSEAWTAAIFIAAALHDVGKLLDLVLRLSMSWSH